MKKFFKTVAAVTTACLLFAVAACSKSSVTYAPITKEDIKSDWLNGEWKLESYSEGNGQSETEYGTITFDVSKNEAVEALDGKDPEVETIEQAIMPAELSGMLSMFKMFGAKVEGDESMMVASDHKTIKMDMAIEVPGKGSTKMKRVITR